MGNLLPERGNVFPLEASSRSQQAGRLKGHGFRKCRLLAGAMTHLFQFSLRSRWTAMLAGLRTLTQTGHGPDR